MRPITVCSPAHARLTPPPTPPQVYITKQPPMCEENEADGPYSVVMAPTRELAQQIEEETLKLASFTPYRVTSIVGGQSIEEQVRGGGRRLEFGF